MKLKNNMKLKYIMAVLITVICLGACWVYMELNSFKPSHIERLSTHIMSNEIIEKDEIVSILTWNIGYAGLGKEADCIRDGGKSIFPKSKETSLKNLKNITEFIKKCNSDIYLFQEAASDSRITFNIDIIEKIQDTLQRYNSVFAPTVYVKNLPLLGNIITGNSSFSKYLSIDSKQIALPTEDKIIFNTKHNFIQQRFPIEGTLKEWVIMNIHLSAFDDGNLRNKQLKYIKEFMINEYNKGNYVVVGGDWNHRLTETSFKNNTKKKYLFWIKDIPQNFTPKGWQWGIDISNPTVRTLERPYVKEENYTCITDGFLVSPNVEIIETKCFNLGFEESDHHPVAMKVKAVEIK